MNVVTQFPAAHEYQPDPCFRAMFEGAAIGIGICQFDGRIMEANPALSRMLGYSQQELAGAQAGEFYPELRRGPYPELCADRGREIHPDDFSPDERLLAELMRGERGSFEIDKRYRRKDGSEFWGHLTVSLGRDSRHQPAFLIAVLADASERRRVEAHLREAEKMEVIGRLAGGIAHDFNNLLTGILLYCDLLSAGLENGTRERELEDGRREGGGMPNHAAPNYAPPDVGLPDVGPLNLGLTNPGLEAGELRQHVEEVRMAGEQGAALTHQLLAIARKQAAEPRPISINEIVASTDNLLRRLIGEQIELAVSLDSALDSGGARVLADPAQLRQILMNLVLNARDAMPQGGKIKLSTRAAKFPGEVSGEVSSDAEPGAARRAVSLVVEDNGCGMDTETRARLFEPFFTTKNPGEGTGLGLATVQRIVSESGGTIVVETEPGRGTCIEVFFRALAPAAGETASEKSSKPSTDHAAPSPVPARHG